jgi:hypothetical protein
VIKIKLNPTVFDSGGVFETEDPKKAVVFVQTARNDVFSGQVVAQGYLPRPSQYGLAISRNGVEINDFIFEQYMSKDTHYTVYGAELLTLAQGQVIIVEHNGTALTVEDMINFTA